MLNLEYYTWHWADALSSFAAIFLAGLLIAFYNHRFLKKERRQRIADAFCVRLEEVIIDYFNQSVKEARENTGQKFLALLDAFSLFIKNDGFVANDQQTKDQLSRLLNLDLDKGLTERERMSEALCALAVIRYRLTR